MEFGREAVAEHLVKNNMPRFKDWELDLSGAINGMMDFNTKLDEIAKDIRDKKDNVAAMEFTKCIGELLKKNGVVPKMTEYTRNFEADNTFEARYGVSIDELDFSEHDKPFKDKIAKLEEEIHRLRGERKIIRQRCLSDGELHLFDVKRYDRLHIVAKDVIAENAELKKRIAELEHEKTDLKHGLNEMEKIKSHWIDKAVEWQQKCEKLEGEKSENCEENPISDDVRPSAEWYENRYQQDCIEINRLNTTIDVLIHKIEHLRQFAGLE